MRSIRILLPVAITAALAGVATAQSVAPTDWNANVQLSIDQFFMNLPALNGLLLIVIFVLLVNKIVRWK
jgi:hypothetical protein